MTSQPCPQSYLAAESVLNGRDSRKIANNTYLERHDNSSAGVQYKIRLHGCCIITFNANGSFILKTDGWETSTTRERIRRYLPPGFYLWSEKGEWMICDRRPQFLPPGMTQERIERWGLSQSVPFKDGMLILADASLHGIDRREADCALARNCHEREERERAGA